VRCPDGRELVGVSGEDVRAEDRFGDVASDRAVQDFRKVAVLADRVADEIVAPVEVHRRVVVNRARLAGVVNIVRVPVAVRDLKPVKSRVRATQDGHIVDPVIGRVIGFHAPSISSI